MSKALHERAAKMHYSITRKVMGQRLLMGASSDMDTPQVQSKLEIHQQKHQEHLEILKQFNAR